MRVRRRKAPPWSAEEIAILIDVYPREGINGAADALPERSWNAILVMASKLGVRSQVEREAPTPELSGERLEEAIRLRELEGWSFMRIGKHFGVSEGGATNAILIALCPRKGFTPAPRDDKGRLLPEGVDQLRAKLRQGAKAVDIALQLGLSQSRIAEERRRYSADLKARGKRPLPPPGNGARYSGARVARDVYKQVDELFLKGFGVAKIAEWTEISRTHALRRRAKLIARLRRRGECLPGCDLDGKRHAYKDSLAAVSDVQKEVLRAELMKGTPVARAAKIAVIGSSFAYQLRDELKAELEAKGRSLPPTIRLGRVKAEAVDRALNWLPAGKRNLILYRRILGEVDGDMAEAKRRTIAALMPKPARPAETKRPLTFEEKLARVAAGAKLVEIVPLRRPGPEYTLGGVSAGMV